MGFVTSIFGGNSGGSFTADQNPDNVANLKDQYGVVKGAEGNLNDIIAGKGPNPALDQLKATTNQNVQQTAAAVNSQKGINPAMAARLDASTLSNLNQEAAGQAAITRGTQQLGAIQNLGNLSVGQQGVSQAGIDSANKANAGTQQGNQAAQQGLLGGAGAAVTSLFADGGEVEPAIANPLAPWASKAANYLKGPGSFGSSMQALGSKLGSLFSSTTTPAAPVAGNTAADYQGLMDAGTGQGNAAGDYINLPGSPGPQFNAEQLTADPSAQISNGTMMAARGGKVPALLSPGEVYIPPGKVKAAASAKDPRAVGKKVPGKAEVKGDSLKNDKVKATLDSGGIVLPRSVMQSKDPATEAHKFVSAIVAKNGLKARRKQ
jgi:hypothetical protein